MSCATTFCMTYTTCYIYHIYDDDDHYFQSTKSCVLKISIFSFTFGRQQTFHSSYTSYITYDISPLSASIQRLFGVHSSEIVENVVESIKSIKKIFQVKNEILKRIKK